MSETSTLQADLEANLAEVARMSDLMTAQDVVKHLKDTLWPFLQTVVEEVTSIDGVVEDIVHEADDILQPETAQTFAVLIMACRALIKEFEPRVDKAKEPKVYQGLQVLKKLALDAERVLEEVTVAPDDDDTDEYEEGEDEGEDEEDDDTEEGADK